MTYRSVRDTRKDGVRGLHFQNPKKSGTTLCGLWCLGWERLRKWTKDQAEIDGQACGVCQRCVVAMQDDMQWTMCKDKEYPDEPGWYAVLLPGDSEGEDGYTFYDFPDYVEFAKFHAPVEELPGQETEEPAPYWSCISETDGMIAWCGPYDVPRHPTTRKAL